MISNSVTCVVKISECQNNKSQAIIVILRSQSYVYLVRHFFVLECCADNIFKYVKEIISPDHRGVFLVLPQKTFLLTALHILSTDKHFDSKVSTLLSISLYLY